jgi:hypothetical protein
MHNSCGLFGLLHDDVDIYREERYNKMLPSQLFTFETTEFKTQTLLQHLER